MLLNYLKRVPIYEIFKPLRSPLMTTITSNMTSASNEYKNSIEPEELHIPVPWGFVAAKWWGPKNVRPILALHGWQDNAGTFDRLAPLLPKHVGLLAIDFPGHGLSSPLPNGLSYDKAHFLYVLKLLQKEYKWDKLSIMGHSMGAILGFTFCSIYPDDVDMMISIDGLKLFYVPEHNVRPFMQHIINGIIVETERNEIKSEPPSYTYPELVDKLHAGMQESINKEHAHYLLKRGVQKSELYPGKYFFIRDGRVKFSHVATFDKDYCDELAKRIKAPFCLITFSESERMNREDMELSKNFVQLLNETLPVFDLHLVDGKHHTHLNEPEKIHEIVSEFIQKYRPADAVENSNQTTKSKL